MNPIGPRGVYDEAKRYAEALTMAYHRQQGVDTCIVRIFNTYGPRMRPHDGRAIPTFMRQALANEPLTVFGDGSQTRSFCYVDDLVRGLMALAQSGEHLPVNIGNPHGAHAARARAEGRRGHGCHERDRVRGAAGGRSEGSSAGHHTCPAAAGLGAAGQPRGRAAANVASELTGVTECLSASLCSRRPSLVTAGLAVSAATASPKKHATKQSSHLLVGINDEAFSLYGDPTFAFATLKSLNTQVLRVNLYWGGTKWAVAKSRPTDPTDPGDPAYDWTIYDRLVRYATQNNIKVVFSILFTPGWANGGKARTVAPTNFKDLVRTSRTPRPSGTAASGPRRRGSRIRATRPRSCRSRR